MLSEGPVLSPTLYEGTTGLYTFQLVDEAGSGIASSGIDTLTLTYYEQETGAILNSRDDQSLFNANNGTVVTVLTPSIATTVTWTIQPADTVMVIPTQRLESHVMLFRWTWDSGTRHGAHVAQVLIENLRDPL